MILIATNPGETGNSPLQHEKSSGANKGVKWEGSTFGDPKTGRFISTRGIFSRHLCSGWSVLTTSVSVASGIEITSPLSWYLSN